MKNQGTLPPRSDTERKFSIHNHYVKINDGNQLCLQILLTLTCFIALLDPSPGGINIFPRIHSRGNTKIHVLSDPRLMLRTHWRDKYLEK